MIGRSISAGISKYYKSALVGGAIFGFGAAVASEHPLQGAVDNVLDLAFYDPLQEDQGKRGRDVDNMVLGRDIGFGEMFNIPLNPKKVAPFGINRYDYNTLFNPKSWENFSAVTKNENSMKRFVSGKLDLAKKHESQGNPLSTDNQWLGDSWAARRQYGIPYKPSTYNGSGVSGNLVFGQYNMR